MAYFVWITGRADITLAKPGNIYVENGCLHSTVVPIYLCGESLGAKQAGQGKPLPPADPPGSAHHGQRLLVFVRLCRGAGDGRRKIVHTRDPQTKFSLQKNYVLGAVPYISAYLASLDKSKAPTTFELHTHMAVIAGAKKWLPL